MQDQGLGFNYKDLPDCWQFRAKTNAKVTHFLHPLRVFTSIFLEMGNDVSYGVWRLMFSGIYYWHLISGDIKLLQLLHHSQMTD